MASSSARGRIPRYFLYGEAPRRRAGPLLHIETIEERSARHRWKIDPHLHQDLHQLVFVLRGCGVMMADGVCAQFRPPALALLPAGSVHGFEFEPGTSGHVISLSSDMYRQLVGHAPQVAALFVRPQLLELRREELRAADLVGSVRVLAREFARAGTGHELALDGWLRVMLGNVLRLARDLPDPRDPAVGQRRLLLERFVGLVERRFASGQAVGQYAAALKVSPWQLRRVCLDLAGQSPVQLIHARLLLEAKRQLHYSELAAQEIAGRLGFRDAAYFSRFFSRHAGVSPRVFRREGPLDSPRSARAPG